MLSSSTTTYSTWKGAKGAVWQYTAIDVASAHCWAELHLSPRNPSARWTSELARRVASDLPARGWEVEKAMTDNASDDSVAHVAPPSSPTLGS